MKNLCLTVKQLFFSKFFIDHLTNNNILIEFLPPDMEETEIMERVQILASLWSHQETYF